MNDPARDADSTTPFILLHQMGKVASTAIAEALRRHPRVEPWQVQNTHTLNSVNFAQKRWFFSRPGRSMPPELETGLYLRENVLATGRPLRVISPFREPVARNVSSFFYSLDYYMPEIHRGDDVSMDVITEAFLKRMNHDVCARWFLDELYEPFGIDVYAEPFDHDRGFKTFHRDHVDALVFPFDLPDDRKADAIAGFLGIEPFEITRVNEASDRADAGLYKRFCRDAVLPPEYLDYQYGVPYARHFFTPDQIESFRAKWSSAPSGASAAAA
jgi:hypothetical protein